MLNAWRRWITMYATDAALNLAPRLSSSTVDRLGALVARIGPHTPVISRLVAENMRALGLYSPAAHRDYFAQVAEHFTGALHVLRCAARVSGPSEELTRRVTECIEVDDSLYTLREAVQPNRGAVIVGPHIANFLFSLARLHHVTPMTIYMRYSKHAGRRAAKERWCRANNMAWLVEPPSVAQTTGRLAALVAAVRAGCTLFITPDMPRKRGDGTPVQFLGREIYLPAGATVLAVRTGAPLFFLSAQVLPGGRQKLFLEGPAPLEADDGVPDRARAVVQRQLQWYADRFARFVREQTPLWYSWGDKRWTRVCHGDPRYVGNLPTAEQADRTPAPTHVAGAR